MAKDQIGQISLLTEDEDYSAQLSRPDWAIDCGNWEDDRSSVPTPAPPVQSRSIAQIRADFVARAKGAMPTVPNQLGTIEPSPTPTVPNQLGTIEPSPTPTVPNQLGTIEPSPTELVPNQLGTIEQSPTEIVPNQLGTIEPCPTPNSPQPVGDDSPDRLIDPPKLDRKWNKGHEYYYLRPYIDGKRESFYLGGDIDRAHAKSIAIALRVAAGRSKAQIVADLERQFPKKAKSYSTMVA